LTGVVDQDVDPSEGADRGVDGGGDLSGIGDVAPNRDGVAQFLGELSDPVLAARDQHQLRAVA